jgi:hypothetical protein
MQQANPAPMIRTTLPPIPNGLSIPNAGEIQEVPRTELTHRGNAPRAAELSVPSTNPREASWLRLHERVRIIMNEAAIGDEGDVKAMYKLSGIRLIKNTTSPLFQRFGEEVCGINCQTCEIVPWVMNTQVVPLYMAFFFVLAGTVVPRMRFDDLYTTYFTSIDAVNAVIVEDDPEYSGSIKRILNVHSAGTPASIWHFFNSFRTSFRNRLGAKDKLREWMSHLTRAIKIREIQISREQEVRILNAGANETRREFAQLATEDRGGFDTAELSDEEYE